MIKDSAAQNKRPVKILGEVEAEYGGVMEAHASCDLPRDRQQVYNMKHNAVLRKEKSPLPSSVSRNDTLACIMQQCKDTSSTSEAYIRSVEAAPEPI